MQREFTRIIAIGDPQTEFAKFRAVLQNAELLDARGMLRPDVHLVTLGDYFDFGDQSQRARTASEGIQILRFLAAHPREQVTLIAGNHDLARIGEFITMTDERFDAAVQHASAIYHGARNEGDERGFLAAFPELPTAESAARDFSSFLELQRDLVLELALTGRLRLAAAFGDLLCCHAGVTSDDLEFLGVNAGTAEDAARALNSAFDQALAQWDRRTPFAIPGLHAPGSSASGEGGGILFHRAAHPALHASGYQGPHRRRYDPRRIPRGIVQVIGHVRDKKSRELLGDWVQDAAPPRDGAIRGLWTDGSNVTYRAGFPETGDHLGSIVFIDGGMHHCPTEHYELLDITDHFSL